MRRYAISDQVWRAVSRPDHRVARLHQSAWSDQSAVRGDAADTAAARVAALMRRAGARLTGLAAWLVLAIALLAPCQAMAGPPFRTDDPVPVEPGHWEIFAFSTATQVRGDRTGILPGIDANYGAAPDLQLHAAAPIAFDNPVGGGTAFGYGDSELGFKYRFLAGDGNGWRPQAAIYPAVDFPTGNAARSLGAGHTRVFLPLWVQKGLGKWTADAGVGYWVNPGAVNRNFWYLGSTLQRRVTDNLTIGGEIFHQTADTRVGRDQTGFDFGAIYDLSEHYHLLLSVGEGLQNRKMTNEFSYYAALQWTF